MKNSIKYVTISVVMIFAVLFLTMTKANASGMQLNFNGMGNGTTNSATTNGTQNLTTNATPVNNATQKENLVRVNEINDANKDIPQTGESDVYIVAGIAILTVAVGAVAFMKSKKYNI